MKLNDEAIGLMAASIGLGVLAGSSGVTTLFTSSTPRYVVGAVGLALQVGAGVTTALSTLYGTRYAAECTEDDGARR